MNILLIGHPNSGKSTLHNALTNAHQKVGNWHGVTVEKKVETFQHKKNQFQITDLPGIQSLNLFSKETTLDQQVVFETLQDSNIDLIINVIDINHLEHQLYLTTQLLELKQPMIVVLNKVDVVKNQHIIDSKALEKKLGCPVIQICACKKQNVSELKKSTLGFKKSSAQTGFIFAEQIEQSIKAIVPHLSNTPEHLKRIHAIQLLEGENGVHLPNEIKTCQKTIEQSLGEEADIAIASARYEFAHQAALVTFSNQNHENKESLLDKLFLNRILGIPLFLSVMYALFFFSTQIATLFQEAFEIIGKAIFVDATAYWLHQWGLPNWITAILSNGIGTGIVTTISFVPILGAIFFALSFLELSGYMARAAFVTDRAMKALGLSGQSFIPLLIGLGCNVPGIMATRTLSNKKDRIITIMMTPFMSCTARLAIYSIFATTFFPNHAANVIFLLYLVGIAVAVLTACLLRNQFSAQSRQNSVIEIPAYHLPSFAHLTRTAWHRLKQFIIRAGKFIIPISGVIYLLNAITLSGTIHFDTWQAHSLLAELGKLLTPLFAPMGIQENNWQATVGLLSGILAKEVVIGTLNALYTGAVQTAQSVPTLDLWGSLQEAWNSIAGQFGQLKTTFLSPFSTELIESDPTQNNQIYQHFGSPIAAFAYLLFILLYIPCMSTFAATAKELNTKWAFISIAWATGLAYCIAVLFYQIATLASHFYTSISWIAFAVILLGFMTWFLQETVKKVEGGTAA